MNDHFFSSHLQSIVEHISDMVTNVHALNTEDLDRLMLIIRQHKEKLDSVRLKNLRIYCLILSSFPE